MIPSALDAPLYLDISRLLSRATHPVPTGIDRVELAYAEWLVSHVPHRLHFVAVHPLGRFAPIAPRTARLFIARLIRRWRVPGTPGDKLNALVSTITSRLLVRSALPWSPTPGVYLLTSHHHLNRPGLIETMRQRMGTMLTFIHDLIPIEYPEYARPGEPERHKVRMKVAAQFSDWVVVNSIDTAHAFARCLREEGRDPPMLVAPLGIDPVRPRPRTAPTTRPMFLYVSTIEPRKNHLLLLHIWRNLVNLLGEAAPRLILVGRRGWENENILDILERCEVLRGFVEERNLLSDSEMQGLMTNARALLLPSFAEGYGLPLAEALAAGVPALCSDLPALREVGGDVPEYLDPLDGPGWTQAIMDYAQPHSSRRADQLARLPDWSPPGWDAHLRAVMALIDENAPIRRDADGLLHAAD